MPHTADVPDLARRARYSFRLFAVLAIGVCALTYAICAHYDVSALDQEALIGKLARAQTDSDLLVWQDAFDQRAWLRARLADPRTDDGLLVLGSSTVGGLTANMFPGEALLNGWMGAPTIEDFEAATVLIDRAPRHPRTVVLGIDAWFLNPVVDDQRWRSLTDEYVTYRRARGDGIWINRERALRWWAMFKERMTFTTLRETLVFVRRAHRAREPLAPRLVRAAPARYCAHLRSPEYIRTLVGDYVTCAAMENPQAVVDSEAATYVIRNTHSMAEWRGIDRSRAQRLEDVVRHIRHSGVSVVLVAPPYHPAAYAALRADPLTAHNLDETDRILERMAHATGAVYVNLRDPATLACTATDFMDSHHTKATCGQRIAARVGHAAALPPV